MSRKAAEGSGASPTPRTNPVCPCPVRHRLARDKHGIFNPDLPTLRHMERDEIMHKLPEEHCRHTTRCTADQFAGTYKRPFRLPDTELHCLNIPPADRAVTRHYNTLKDLQDSHKIWSRYINNKGLNQQAPQPLLNPALEPNLHDWHFDGVALRVIKPEIRDWRQTLRCDPGLDQSGRKQRITPSDNVNRHRSAYSSYLSDVALCTRRL